MPLPDGSEPARSAIDGFIRDLASRGFAGTTQRIRRHFLEEYLAHARQAADTGELNAGELSVGELMDPARADAWLSDAAAGRTRTRNSLRGRQASAYRNSMRVRIDSWNAFAAFLGLPGRRDTEPPAAGRRLTQGDTARLLRDLAVRRPVSVSAASSLRTAAVAAVIADTERDVPEIAQLTLTDLHLDGAPRVGLADGPCPLSAQTVQVLTRWLRVRAEITAELEGTDPGYLWIPVKPGRPRGGRDPVRPGLKPAAVRTLHHAHRTLVSRVLGTPLRPGAFHPPYASGPPSDGRQ
jgi:hypothetical protein